MGPPLVSITYDEHGIHVRASQYATDTREVANAGITWEAHGGDKSDVLRYIAKFRVLLKAVARELKRHEPEQQMLDSRLGGDVCPWCGKKRDQEQQQ